MKHRIVFSNLLLLALSLAVAPTAFASTTWYVNGVSGSDGNNCTTPTTACKTIGHAISLASSGDSIRVAAATYTENLTIRFSLRLVGSGAVTTIIDGGGVSTVVTISNANAHVTLSKVTIRNGVAVNGGGINNSGTLTINNSTVYGNAAAAGDEASGGGIYNGGTLTIGNSAIGGNSAGSSHSSAYGGGIYNSGTLTISNNSAIGGNIAKGHDAGVFGGGIFNLGTLTINDTIVFGNNAGGLIGFGGGILNSGKLTISDSTISQNSTGGISPNAGGGIDNVGPSTIRNSTISGNSAGSCRRGPIGGGIYNGGTAILQNTIVANSPNGGNCYGTMTSKGYNLSSDGTCNLKGAGDLNNTNPLLGPLQNNGGPTQTQALLAGSPAIDAGNPGGCTDSQGNLLKTDQRGKPRPDKEDTGGCDMGAYERQKD